MRKFINSSKFENMNRDLSFLKAPSHESAGILHVQKMSPQSRISSKMSARKEESEGSNLKLLVISPPKPENDLEQTVTNSNSNTPDPESDKQKASMMQEELELISAQYELEVQDEDDQ